MSKITLIAATLIHFTACGVSQTESSSLKSGASDATGTTVLGQGDYRASSAPGSLRDYVIAHARKNATRDANRKCAGLGFNGTAAEVGPATIATGLENGYVWATYDSYFSCQNVSPQFPTVTGNGVGTSLISVPNAQSLAYANALNVASNRCVALGYYQAPRLAKTVDSHWSCVGSSCTAWFTGIFQCPR